MGLCRFLVCPFFPVSLNALAGDRCHLVNVLMLVLHGGAHGRVSDEIHYRKQVLGRAIRLGSNTMTSTVEDEIVRQPS